MATPPLVLHAFPSFAVGGAQARFCTLANHFGPRLRHAIVAMDGDTSCRERLAPGLDVTFLNLKVLKGDLVGTLRLLRATLRTLRPAMLVTSNWGTIEWALANRLQLVPHLHMEDGFGPDERTAQLPRRVWTRRLALAGRDVMVPSRTLQHIALDTWRLAPARVRLVPNGIDLQRFATGSPNLFPGEGPVVGTIAALRAEKNVGRLVRAFAAAARPGRLLIVGDGPERPALEQLAAELGIAGRTHFAGHIADPVAHLHVMDLFVISSDTEQMPISLLEAMAAGRAVASTRVGDVAHMLPMSQQPYVVPIEDAALAASLRNLLDDAGLRADLGRANLRHVSETYGQDRMFAAWERLLAPALTTI